MKEHRNQARWIAVLAATAIALYLCWLMLRPFIGVLEWAAVLVIVFYPVHKRLASGIYLLDDDRALEQSNLSYSLGHSAYQYNR